MANFIKPVAVLAIQFVSLHLYGQIHISWLDYINISDDHSVYLDTLTKDTLHHDRTSSQFYLISREGVVLKRGPYEGGMGTKCGCTPEPHGQWVERYRNGALKETGEYNCNRKTGTWTYYYENGQIAKIETWKHPYFEFATQMAWEGEFGGRALLLDGCYSEYYPNGKPKIEGRYEIVDVKDQVDSMLIFDPDTYKDVLIPVEKLDWVRKSVKVGIWKEFDETGTLIREEKFDPFYNEVIYAIPIGSRYYRNHKQLFRNITNWETRNYRAKY